MDSPFMAYFAEGLAGHGHRVVRFEFPYMAARGHGGSGRMPDKAPVLLATWRQVVGALDPERLVIGGKSLGGRMASLVADEVRARGLLCLGYPFHPPDRPDELRTAHLAQMRTPTLILQGTRDPFGSQDEVEGLPLSPSIRIHWLTDGDHGFTPRVRSGATRQGNWAEALAAMAAFLAGLA
jgi:hypothetical protein